MKKGVLIFIFLAATLSIFLLAKSNREDTIKREEAKNATERGKEVNIAVMKISSPAFTHNGRIPSQYTCDGENVSPPLQLTDIPAHTKSLAFIVDDPDAPAKTWVHWVVYHIAPDVLDIAENSIPSGGIEGMTDFGKPGYGGPCPPSGIHRYFFKVYALDAGFDLGPQANDILPAPSGGVSFGYPKKDVFSASIPISSGSIHPRLNRGFLEASNKAAVERAMENHILGKGELIGLYSRE